MAPLFPGQEAAPDDSHLPATRPRHYRHHAIVPSSTILSMIHQIYKHTSHDVPLHDLSGLVTTDMRLSLSIRSDSPHIAPLLDSATFDTCISGSYRILDPSIIPTEPPPAEILEHPPRCAFYYGSLFYAAFRHFEAGNFFWEHIKDVKKDNPDLAVGKYSPAPDLTWLGRDPDGYGQLLDDGERDHSGELIWKAFGGLYTDGLEGAIMGSRVNGEFMVGGGEDVVSKAELLVMLIQLAYKAQLNEGYPTKDDLPQIMVINFTGEYARVVQGALVPPCLDTDLVELRISVSANLYYLDEKTNTIIPNVWKQLLGWTFCRAVKTTHDGNAGEPREGNEKLVVPKVRREGTDEWEDEVALRNASKSSTSPRNQETSRRPGSGRTSPISSLSSPTSPL